MEKESQPESLATVAIKPDYPPSEVYGSEPPPAYHRGQSSAVQVAKIIAVTVVLVSVVLGGFILASAYVTANASCRQLQEELELLSEAAERMPLQPEALVQEEPEPKQSEVHQQKVKPEEKESDPSDNRDDDSSSSSESEEDEEKRITFKLPLQLDFDDLAGALMEKNQRSRMNCIVEKKRAEEFVDHKPKTVNLPFGVNLTTDPRIERLSGERMAIFCESGNMQSHAQPQEQSQEDTVMIQPVMIPLVGNHYATHMPQEAMPPQREISVHPMESLRPPVANPMVQQQQQQQQQSESQMPPAFILHNIAQQIIAQRIMDSQREQEEAQNTNEVSQPEADSQQRYEVPDGMVQRIPIPEEILSQINRLPSRGGMIVVSEQEPEEAPQEVRIVEQSRPNMQEMNARQSYARGLPVHIPVPMMQQEQQEQQQQAASEEARPHYVQPRSVRSVDALLPKSQKRMKRCACDCAC